MVESLWETTCKCVDTVNRQEPHRTRNCIAVNKWVGGSLYGATEDDVVTCATVWCPAPTVGGIKWWCASDVCLSDFSLSRTSALNREQRGPGRLKLAQR